MKLAKFLNSLFIKNGFILIDADSNKYKIGNPKKENPITLRLLDRSLHSKLLFHPDLYFGEAYSNGSVVIENGSLTDFLEIAFENIGRGEINNYGMIINKLRGFYKTLTSFNFIKKSKKMLHIIMIYLKNFMIYFWTRKDNILARILKMKKIL